MKRLRTMSRNGDENGSLATKRDCGSSKKNKVCPRERGKGERDDAKKFAFPVHEKKKTQITQRHERETQRWIEEHLTRHNAAFRR